MALNPAKVGLAVQSGVSIVCATCQRYWEGRDKNLPGSRCTSATACGSPLAGDDFHAYVGPITDFTRWCFMCGTDAHFAVRKPGSQRLFGVCGQHAKYLHEMRPVQALAPQEQQAADSLLVRTAQGSERRPLQLFGMRKKNLREVIWDTEEEWSKTREGEPPDGV